MLNADTGEIRLHRSNFVLHAGVTPQSIEEQLAEQIIHRRETDNHYVHYWLCADIASPEYITANLIFFKNRLLSISLFPQDHSETVWKTLAPPTELQLAQNIVRAWYQKYFSEAKMSFQWGTIGFCEGSDPIYYPPAIVIKYS